MTETKETYRTGDETRTQAQQLTVAWSAYLANAHQAFVRMPNHSADVTNAALDDCRESLAACLEHLIAMQWLVSE